jgi:hypothetical protein
MDSEAVILMGLIRIARISSSLAPVESCPLVRASKTLIIFLPCSSPIPQSLMVMVS